MKSNRHLPATTAEYRRLMEVGQAEDEFMNNVIELAHIRGWLVAHFRSVRIVRRDGSTFWATPVQADGKGFVDLELCRDRVVHIELKKAGGTRSPEQLMWAERLLSAGAEYYCWQPTDWVEIEAVLL